MATTYEPIATTTLGSAASSITFSSISSAYTDLRFVVAVKPNDTTTFAYVQFNNDTGSNYSGTELVGNGASAASYRESSSGNGVPILIADYIPNQNGLITLDIFSYSGSTNKTTLATYSGDNAGSGYVSRAVGLWRNTAAITSVKLVGGNFAAGTTATLYGIKNA
jgi:hypothetical protein